jgi:Zn-dependent protease with chaperone function
LLITLSQNRYHFKDTAALEKNLIFVEDRMKLHVVIRSVIVFCLFGAYTAIAAEESFFKNMEFTIVPLPNKVLTGYPYDMSDDYYFLKSVSRIFVQKEPLKVKAVEVDLDDNVLELTLANGKYGTGVIKIISGKDLEKLSNEELKTVIDRSLSDEKLSAVVADTRKKIMHMPTCNHLPSAKDREHLEKRVAVSNGYKPCGVCFREILYLTDIGIESELQNKAAAELRHYNPVLSDPSVQARVDRVGRKVLESWPYPLIQYDHRFVVVESKDINAYALAAGTIFVTTGLINAVENDDELEAVLAHELAHVQRRHSLQAYKKAVSAQQAQMVIGAIGSVAAGAAAAQNNNSVAIATAGITLASMVAINIQLSGYSKEQEMEADEMAFRYFARLKKDLQPVRNVFRKLMYHNLALRQNPDPFSLTHPALGDRITELDFKEVSFPENIVYHLVRNETPVQIQLLSITERNGESEATLYVTDLAALRGLLKEAGRVRFKAGDKWLDYELDVNDVPIDPWGAIVSARGKASELAKLQITGIEIEDFAKDPNFGYPINKRYHLTKGAYY